MAKSRTRSETRKAGPQEEPPRAPSLVRESEEIRIARITLNAMIPQQLPSAEGIDMASLYLPCSRVGGDLFDVMRLGEDLFAFVIFDMAGQGVSSALMSSMAKVSFVNHIRNGASPRTVMERVSADMAQCLSPRSFLTAFVGFLDLHNNRLTYCCAGLSNQLLYRKTNRELSVLASTGTPLGILDRGIFGENNVFLSPGDWLVMHTNGLYALFDALDELKGSRMLEAELLRCLDETTPAQMVQRLRMRFDSLARQHRPEDDVAAIAVAILTQSRRNQIKEQLGFGALDPVYLQRINYFEEMDGAIGAILRGMDNHGYPDDVIRKMKIALTELLVNALDHGNGKDPGKKVTVGHLVDGRRVEVSVMDEGPGFDPQKVPDPTLPENLERDSGRGLFIVRSYVDEIRFNPHGNRVTIVKNLA